MAGRPSKQTCLSALAALAVVSGCARPPVSVIAQSEDQISICRETDQADFQEAEDVAASFCTERHLHPRLAGTARCSSHAVRYNYICTTPHF